MKGWRSFTAWYKSCRKVIPLGSYWIDRSVLRNKPQHIWYAKGVILEAITYRHGHLVKGHLRMYTTWPIVSLLMTTTKISSVLLNRVHVRLLAYTHQVVSHAQTGVLCVLWCGMEVLVCSHVARSALGSTRRSPPKNRNGVVGGRRINYSLTASPSQWMYSDTAMEWYEAWTYDIFIVGIITT